MGHWTIVINGHGGHDNGRDDDADAICGRFLAELARNQDELSCLFTVGVQRVIAAPVTAGS